MITVLPTGLEMSADEFTTDGTVEANITELDWADMVRLLARTRDALNENRDDYDKRFLALTNAIHVFEDIGQQSEPIVLTEKGGNE